MNMGKTLSVRTDLAYDERNKVEDSLSEEIKIVNHNNEESAAEKIEVKELEETVNQIVLEK